MMMKRLDFGSFGCHTDMAGRAGTNSNARNSDVTHVEVKTPNFASTKSKKASQNQKAKKKKKKQGQSKSKSSLHRRRRRRRRQSKGVVVVSLNPVLIAMAGNNDGSGNGNGNGASSTNAEISAMHDFIAGGIAGSASVIVGRELLLPFNKLVVQ